MAAKKSTPTKTAPKKDAIDTDAITLGPLASAVKGKVSKKQWSTLVKQAHARGFAINSYLDTSTPDPLKQRTQASLAAQAKRTVAAAYKPAETELSQAESRIKAIQDKRDLDNKYYQDWLASKNAELATQQQTNTKALTDGITALQNSTAQAYAGQQGQEAAQLAATPGAVSDFSQSKALNIDLTAQQMHGLSQMAATGSAALTQQGVDNTQLAQTQANAFAFMAAQRAKQQSDTFTELAKVADARQKLVLDKAAAASKEASRLLDNEVNKANSNRNYQAAAEKLGLQTQQFLADDANKKASLAIQGKNADTAAKRADETNRHNLASEEEAKAARLQRKYLAQHPIAKAAKRKGGSGAKSSDPQKRFEFGYAALRSARNPAGNNAPYTVNYVKANRDLIVAQLQTDLKITKEMASRIVRAFIYTNRGDAGSYKDWAKEPTQTVEKSSTVEEALGGLGLRG